MDFRVYHSGALGVFEGTRPVYGETSGLGWPMHYRYPPLFLLLFAPFAFLPIGVAAVIWLILKIFVLLWLLSKLVEFPPPPRDFFITFLLITPYLVEEFRYGNAQFFIFGLTAPALLLALRQPLLSSASLA